jgi:hypothetical protein
LMRSSRALATRSIHHGGWVAMVKLGGTTVSDAVPGSIAGGDLVRPQARNARHQMPAE